VSPPYLHWRYSKRGRVVQNLAAPLTADITVTMHIARNPRALRVELGHCWEGGVVGGTEASWFEGPV